MQHGLHCSAVCLFDFCHHALQQAFCSTGGATNTQDALRVVYQSIFTPSSGDRPSARNVAIVVTDGWSDIQPLMTVPMADVVRQHGIELYAVAVGSNPNMTEVSSIANQPVEDHVISGLVSLSNVTACANRLLDLLCNNQ